MAYLALNNQNPVFPTVHLDFLQILFISSVYVPVQQIILQILRQIPVFKSVQTITFLIH